MNEMVLKNEMNDSFVVVIVEEDKNQFEITYYSSSELAVASNFDLQDPSVIIEPEPENTITKHEKVKTKFSRKLNVLK